MAILEANSVQSKSGFKKRIDEDSQEIMLNIVQVNIYSYPFKSMVRELVSNSLDSVREKNMAINILNGREKIEDYFVEKEGTIYKDSKFDPTYYDLKYLNSKDETRIQYLNLIDEKRDMLIISDTGIGLGGRRLEKFFVPGYSTKRLNKKVLGSYGLGNKSPLATQIEFYTLISIYNGKKFEFDIYIDKVDCVYGKFNEDGTLNKFIEFDQVDEQGNKIKAYYKETNEKNSVTINIPIKKHNKHLVIEAIKSQLMYFRENIIAFDDKYPINFKSNIFFEDEDLILSDSNYFNKPHFVMNSVNYGVIDFNELELDQRYGNVGFKVDPSEVDVDPSRESITYSDRTRQAVINKYNKISEKVSKKVEEKLDTDNILEWVTSAVGVMYTSSDISGDRSINILSKMIDRSTLDLTFKLDKTIKFSSDLKVLFTDFLKFEKVYLEHSGSWRNDTKTLKRVNLSGSNELIAPFYFQTDTADTNVTKYLVYKHSNFTIIKAKTPYADLNKLVNEFIKNKSLKKEDALQPFLDIILENDLKLEALKEEDKKVAVKSLSKTLTKLLNILDFVRSSKTLSIYEDVVVPADFKVNGVSGKEEGDENVDVIIDEALEAKINLEKYKEILKQRKQNEEFVINYFKYSGYGNSPSNYSTTSEVVKRTDIKSEIVVYGTSNDRDKLTNLIMALNNIIPRKYYNHHDCACFNDQISVILISKDNEKYFDSKKDFYVDNFGFFIDDNKTLRTYDFLIPSFEKQFLMDLGIDVNLLTTNLLRLYPKLAVLKTKLLNLKDVKAFSETSIASVNKYVDLYKIYELQKKFILNKITDEEVKDKMLTSVLHIDIVDSMDKIEFFKEDNMEELLLFRDVSSKFKDLLAKCNSHSKLDQDLIKLYVKKNSHLLELDHEDFLL